MRVSGDPGGGYSEGQTYASTIHSGKNIDKRHAAILGKKNRGEGFDRGKEKIQRGTPCP